LRLEAAYRRRRPTEVRRLGLSTPAKPPLSSTTIVTAVKVVDAPALGALQLGERTARLSLKVRGSGTDRSSAWRAVDAGRDAS
jgi:hypothetical protein